VTKVIRIGMDTSKQVFQLHGVDEQEQVVVRRALRRSAVEKYFAALPPTVIGIEACGAAHHWARRLQALGHEVRLVPPQYVKPYVKRGKNDAADAAAICEAMSRPSMRFVPVKSAAQQGALMLHGGRTLLMKQRTMLINAIRGHAAEFGVVGGKGAGKLATVLERAQQDPDLPAVAKAVLTLLGEQLAGIEAALEALEARLMAWHCENAVSRRLAEIPGVGPISATALTMKVPDAGLFRSGRDFAAWLGLTPKDHSTGGRQRLGSITRAGDEMLRALLIAGAMAVIRQAKPGRSSSWLLALLANKSARIAWAMMVSGESYRRPAPAAAAA
jgi:transposase